MAKNKPLISFMSDDEFVEYKQQEEKRKFIEDLQQSSRQGATSFSVKQLKNVPKPQEDTPAEESEITSIEDVIQNPNTVREIPEDVWESMLDQFQETDPIDEISDSGRFLYRSQNSDDVADKFNNEISILHELLKQSKDYSKMIKTRIKARDANLRSGKTKGGGISKYDIELFDTSNSMISTQLNIASKLADIKTKIEDIRLKQLKNNPPEDLSNESQANQFYASIMGNRSAFMSAVTGGGFDSSNSGSDLTEGELITSNQPARSLTDPIGTNYEDNDYDDLDTEADPYNYIENETKDVNVYVQIFKDGDKAFVALDGNGDEVLGYGLPSPDLLPTLKFPMNSSYCSDAYGRRYKIIEVDEDSYFESDIED